MESEIAAKYRAAGHSDPEKIAADIVALKETDVHLSKSHIKANPDLPDQKDLRLFLVFDGAAEVDSEDTVFDSMFSAFSNQDMTTGGHQVDPKPKKEKGKKRRRSSSSEDSSETDTSGEVSSTESSSSSNKKNKKKKKDKKGKKSKKASNKGSKKGSKKNKGQGGGLKRAPTAKELERKAQEEKKKEEEKAEKKREREQLKQDKEAARDKERERNMLIRDGKKALCLNCSINYYYPSSLASSSTPGLTNLEFMSARLC